jgi:hypothetical protein
LQNNDGTPIIMEFDNFSSVVEFLEENAISTTSSKGAAFYRRLYNQVFVSWGDCLTIDQWNSLIVVPLFKSAGTTSIFASFVELLKFLHSNSSSTSNTSSAGWNSCHHRILITYLNPQEGLLTEVFNELSKDELAHTSEECQYVVGGIVNMPHRLANIYKHQLPERYMPQYPSNVVSRYPLTRKRNIMLQYLTTSCNA